MGLYKKGKLRKTLRKLNKIFMPGFVVLLMCAVVFFGYWYFFESPIKADYYFWRAQRLDNANPYGSREAIGYYQKSIASYEKLGDRGAAVNAYIDLAMLHHKFGNITQVERLVMSAMELGGDDIPKQMRAKSYMLLASTVEPDRAKEYIREAISIASELSQPVILAKSYGILAKINEYQASFEAARNNYVKAIKLAESLPTGSFPELEMLYANLGKLYIEERGDVNTDNAINSYEKALAAARYKTPHSVEAADYMKTLGDLYRTRMATAKACQNWQSAIEEYTMLGKQPPMEILQFTASEDCRK